VADEAHQRLIGRCSWVAAWVGLVVGQVHVLSRVCDGRRR
jgi:hypothetical protein